MNDYQGTHFSIHNTNNTVRYAEQRYSYSIDDYVNYNFLPYYSHPIQTALVIGLGLGEVPKKILKYYPNSEIDVLEIKEELILYHNSQNILKVNYINGDAFHYTSDKKYDLIEIDIWGYGDDKTDNEKDILIRKYYTYLNPKGCVSLTLYNQRMYS